MGKTLRQARAQSRRSKATWQLTFNLPRRIDHLRAGRDVSARASGHVADLRRDGVMAASWAEVFGPDEQSYFSALRQRVQADVAGRSAELDGMRSTVTDDALDHATGNKQFILRLRDEAKGFDPVADADPYLDVATHPNLLEVVEEYMGMRATLTYCNTWLCLPTPAEESAHLWHRDPEDRHIVKVFVYLEDVGPAEGPFHYARGSQPDATGSAPRLPARFGKEPRLGDGAMAEVVPTDRWLRAEGPAGTVLLADTAGYHKGPNREADRLTFVASYVSAAAQY